MQRKHLQLKKWKHVGVIYGALEIVSYKKASWIENIKGTYKNNETQKYKDITILEIINTLKCTHKS